jgi:hypothetical protein
MSHTDQVLQKPQKPKEQRHGRIAPNRPTVALRRNSRTVKRPRGTRRYSDDATPMTPLPITPTTHAVPRIGA